MRRPLALRTPVALCQPVSLRAQTRLGAHVRLDARPFASPIVLAVLCGCVALAFPLWC
jgi:hypothetical protein